MMHDLRYERWDLRSSHGGIQEFRDSGIEEFTLWILDIGMQIEKLYAPCTMPSS
jgi:hypothetical protein